MALDLEPLVVGLPEGPATGDSVKALLPLSDQNDDDRLALAINAVNEFVVELPIVEKLITPPIADGAVWPHRVRVGATLLALRLFKRSDSPIGIASFGEEGAVYVQRNDPDIAQMLKIGSYTAPAVG